MTVDVFSAKKIEGEVRLDPATTAILIVDMLNEFCKPGGAMVLPGYEALVAPQRRLIEAGAPGPAARSCSWSTATAPTSARTANG